MDPVNFDGATRMGFEGARSEKPSAKIKQKCSITRCGMEEAPISRSSAARPSSASLPLTHEGDLLGPSERTLYGWRFVNPSKDDGFADDPKNPMGRATRAVAAIRERLLRPYLERSPKTISQDCGLYGVDHRTYCGATPLMLAARAGNVALVEQLLERGADADLVDDYGHTAWMGALNRGIDDHAFGKAHLGRSSSAWAGIRSMFTRTGGSCGGSAVRAGSGCWVRCSPA